jgi:predicted O-linked N-acetylglucosamine transferase (SPINDLY family)
MSSKKMSERDGTAQSAAANPLEQARMLYANGRWNEAEPLCRSILERDPGEPGALSLLGIMLARTRRTQEAAELLGRAAEVMPESAEAHTNHGSALRALGRHHDALACYERALALKPESAEAHYNRGLSLSDLRQYAQAIESYERAVGLKPDYAAAWNNRGGALQRLGRSEEALASIDRAIALQPNFAPAHLNRGMILHVLGRLEEALASFDRAIAAQPNHADAHAHRGATLTAIGRYAEALASCDRALAIDARCLNALVNRGVALNDLKRFHDALGSFDQAIHLGRWDAHVHHCRGAVLQELNSFEEAVASYEQALAIDPRARFLRGNCRHARMQICDWSGFERDRSAITAAVERGEACTTPFVLLSLVDSLALQRRAAEIWVREKFSRAPLPGAPRHPRHDRIRVGYFSADLRNHPVAMLTAGLFESHDRSRFELTAFSLGPDVRDELRTRVEAGVDRFVQLDAQTDREVAALARRLEIDIAVDLGGCTRDARPGVMALRAAPIQVGYLGYLGTLGGKFIDYLLADRVLVPGDAREHYSEKIAYLPSYQVNDSRRPVTERSFSRAELCLPPSGFIFCCFNTTYKITPETFDSWMRILAAAPGSALFLLSSSGAAERNLRREAVRCGIAPERLIFGPSLAVAEYLARYRAADLFLDTLPYNAGTTASDALWAGLPVLTLPGESFASRMAASVLTAAGLPELIAQSRADYERRALELATDPERLEALKRKLAVHRSSCALFDTATFTRNLESLYEQMYERYLSGLAADHLFAERRAASLL